MSASTSRWGTAPYRWADLAHAQHLVYLAARYGLRPEPFFLGVAFAALGLGPSTVVVRETRDHARLKAASHTGMADGRAAHLHADLSSRDILVQTSLREPALSAASHSGMVNNLMDGLAWGLFPLLFARAGLSVGQIGVLAALYPAMWGASGSWSPGRCRIGPA